MANRSMNHGNGVRHQTNSHMPSDRTACIDAGRVFDSCSDRDCAEDLRVYFCERDQCLINNAAGVRPKSAKILGVSVDMEPLSFREGCYTCHITFYVQVKLEVYSECGDQCAVVKGCTAFDKRVVLYGGDGSVQVFDGEIGDACGCSKKQMASSNSPHCRVQVAQPVVLDARIAEACGCRCVCCCSPGGMPTGVMSKMDGPLVDMTDGKVALVTVGLFSIVQMIRHVQMLIPVYDYCVPCKECRCDEETPCEIFNKMSFPLEEFFPKSCDCEGKK